MYSQAEQLPCVSYAKDAILYVSLASFRTANIREAYAMLLPQQGGTRNMTRILSQLVEKIGISPPHLAPANAAGGMSSHPAGGWGGVGGHGAGATFNRRNPQVHCPPFVAAGTLSGGWGGPAEAGGGGGIRRGNDGAVGELDHN